METRARRIVSVVFTISLVAGGYYLWSGDAGKQSREKPPVTVNVAPATLQNVPLELREIGTVIPYETVSVRSRIDSQVMEVRFKDGDRVEKGQLLFVLDNRNIAAQYQQAEAAIARDKAQLEYLRQQYERAKQLAAKGFESEAKLDIDRAAYKAQEATVNASLAALKSIAVLQDYTKIHSPITGRTGTIRITTGNNVKANDTEPLVTINQLQPVRVQTALSQNYLDAVRNAMASGSLSVEAMKSDREPVISGKLEYIDNTVDATNGTFTARAIFSNENEALWPGVFVTLIIRLGEERDVITIPEVAVQRGQTGDYVYVINNAEATRRDVTISRMSKGIAVVKEGLKPGEAVATDGMLSLKNGVKVSVKNTADNTTPTP